MITKNGKEISMLRTRIPYDIEKIEEIREHGATVDVSSPSFPGIAEDKQHRTTLVFLRNTGFDVELDFSGCSYEEKRTYLLLYLQEKIEVKYKEFSDTWVKIIMEVLGLESDRKSILSEEELKKFMKENSNYINHVVNFIYSLTLYAMDRYSLNSAAYNMHEFKQTDADDISTNICFILEAPETIMVYSMEDEPMFYTKIFTMENNQLFDALQKLPFMSLLYGFGMYDLSKAE